MKKIGRQVLFLEAGGENARNGEGSFLRLRDGRLLFGYTEYLTADGEDHAAARLVCLTSEDEGETWKDKQVIVPCPDDAKNVMSLSFLRMKNRDLGAFYLKIAYDETDEVCLVRSSDEGKTWSKPQVCNDFFPQRRYYVVCNDRAVRLPSGRILLPASVRMRNPAPGETLPGYNLKFLCSDDDGKTWRFTANGVDYPFADRWGYAEPGLFLRGDGKLWCYTRSALGCQMECFSDDEGETWSTPRANPFFSSPRSPMLVGRAGHLTAAIFNPVPLSVLTEQRRLWGRTPLVCAVSDDGGVTFEKDRIFCLEDDPDEGFCYPAMTPVENGFLVAYYHSNGTGYCLNSLKMVKVSFDELK